VWCPDGYIFSRDGKRCQCISGFTGKDDETCFPCEAGKYKITNGDAECTHCMAGKFSALVAAASDSCQNCRINTNSPPASNKESDCVCNVAFNNSIENSCNHCVEGSYKTSLSYHNTFDNCTRCPTDSNSPKYSHLVDACVCNAGFSRENGNICQQCHSGKYKDSTGNTPCVDCATTTYSSILGANTSSVCQKCADNSQSLQGSTKIQDCLCNSGFSGEYGNLCMQCLPGKYKESSGDDLCVDCMKGTYSSVLGANTSSVCQKCSNNSESVEGSTTIQDCLCNSGSSGEYGNLCIQCLPGKYKEISGNVSCVNCATGTYSSILGAKQSSTCTKCISNSESLIGSINIKDCICSRGFSRHSEDNCIACIVGKFKNSTGNVQCTNCSIGYYSMVVGAKIDSCIKCAHDSYTLLEGSSECISTSVENAVTKPTTTSRITIHVQVSTTPIPESKTNQNMLSSTPIPEMTPTIITLESVDTYGIIFYCKLNLNTTQITDVMKNDIRVETSGILNINITRISLLSFELPISSRRLLFKQKASFSIFAHSLEETKRVQKIMSLDMLNRILLTSSGNMLMATDLEIDIIGMDQDNTPKPQHNNQIVIIIIIFTCSVVCLLGIILICICITKKKPVVFAGKMDSTSYCIVCSYEKSQYSDFIDNMN